MTIEQLFFEGQCKREQSQACLRSAECSLKSIFYQLIRVAIGSQDTLSRPPSTKEWQQLYDMAKKQSLVGICFAAVQHLNSLYPSLLSQLPEMDYLRWMGMAAKIQQRNEEVNRQCVELQAKLSADGFDSIVLKGQGMASLYKVNNRDGQEINLSVMRQSGDIDIWALPHTAIDGGSMVMEMEDRRRHIREYCQRLDTRYNVCNEGYLHTDVHIFADTDVEWHFTAGYLSAPKANRILQEWLDNQWIKMHNSNQKPGKCVQGIWTPSSEFNLVFVLIHIYRHVLFEGIGLRQILDFYFVLIHSTNQERIEAFSFLKSIGVDKFVGAVMYVLELVLNIDISYLICPPNNLHGKHLMEMILEGGNFGRSSMYAITKENDTFCIHIRRYVARNSTLILLYPKEVVWHFIRKTKLLTF